MPRRGTDKNPYHLLDGVIALDDNNELFDRLLGLVTDNLARPLDGFRPEAPFKPKDHISEPRRLYPLKAVECDDVAWLAANTVEVDAKMEFTKLLRIWGDYTHKNDNSWDSTLLRRIEISENPRDRIKELLKVAEYKQGVDELMQSQDSGKDCTLGIITGFITCTDMKVNKEAKRGMGAGLAVKPVSGQVTGTPGTDLGMQGSGKKTRHKAISGAYNGEVVVACSYLPIIRHVDKPNQSWYSFLSWPKDNSPSSSRVQVGEEPMQVQSDENTATFDIGRRTIKGNMSRPLGSGGGASADEEGAQWEELLEYLEDPADLSFTIGRATSTDLIVPESGLEE